MKKASYFLILQLMIFFNIHAQIEYEFDINGLPYQNKITSNNIDFSSNNLKSGPDSWDSIRPLTEINTSSIGQGYPCISSDGLRLYFAEGPGGSANTLYYVSRSNLNSSFSNKKLVFKNWYNNGSNGCWLTNDELEIFFVNMTGSPGAFSYDLKYSKRNSIVDTFANAYAISLEGYNGGFISGPSLTTDKQELYLYNSNNNNNNILKFTMSDSLTYTLNDTLDIPTGFKPGPGHFSKDGLKYYFSLENLNTESKKLYKIERPNIPSTFSDTILLSNYINGNSLINNIQPSISSAEDILVWTRSSDNQWKNNDIYITQNQISSISNIDSKNDSKIYPNPVNETVFFDNTEHKFVKIEIYNSLGECVIHEELNFGENYIEVRSLSKGTYLMKLTNKNREIKNKFIKN